MRSFDVVIVGSGHAGAQAAISLRQFGYKDSIAVLTDENELPYERPPLTKEYLAGEKDFERLLLRPPAFWPQRGITMLFGASASTVDPDRKVVTTADGADIGYGKLVWAAGGRPKKLACEGADAANVYSVRSRADVDLIMSRLECVSRVTVVGGGYIGLETAAVLTRLGKEVVLLEALDRVLARVSGPQLSRFYEEEHRNHGVDLRTGSKIDRIDNTAGVATAVLACDGQRIGTDMVIVGIGIAPQTSPLIAAGAVGNDGIDVDEYCRTTLPDIYAIGDCASHRNRFAGGARVRLESVQNATDQAKAVAAHIVGAQEPYCAVPWFWSNQYDLKLQTVGLSVGHDETILRGEPSRRSFSIVYLKRGKVIAVDCVNSVRDYVQARAHVTAQAELDPTQLGDPAVQLKDVARRSAGPAE